MPTWPDLLPFLLLGVVGSLHCAGMCGGFAAAVALGTSATRRRTLGYSLLHVLGKAATYAILGLVAAQAGHLLVHGGASLLTAEGRTPALALERARSVMAWGTGGLFVLFALRAAGVPVLPRRLGDAALARVPSPLEHMFAAARALPVGARSFGLGLANGLLPCGLSWAALALALGSSPAVGMLGMFAFGVGTAPILVAIGVLGSSIPPAVRSRLLRFAAPLLVLFGLLTFARGGVPVWGQPVRGALPSCCSGADDPLSPGAGEAGSPAARPDGAEETTRPER